MGGRPSNTMFLALCISPLGAPSSRFREMQIGGAAKDKLIEQILNAQTSQIDGVTGATVTSKAVQNAVADCIQQASGGAINPAQQPTEEASSAADWLGEEPEIAESDIKQTVDCEVLVVGAGSSGSFAAACPP